MKKKLLVIILVCGMLLSGCGAETAPSSVPAGTEGSTAATGAAESPASSAKSTAEAAEIREQLHQAILDFCGMLFGSLRYDSTVTFGWDDFDSIEGYMIAKWVETRRECYKIDGTEVTDVRVRSVELKGSPIEQDGHLAQCALVNYEYVSGDMETRCLTRYIFFLREEENGCRVTDVTTYNPAYSIEAEDDMDIAVFRDSLDLWKEECKDAGDRWQFEAVDRMMEQKKVPLEELIPDEMKEELERRQKKTAQDAEVTEIRFNEAYDRPDAPMESGVTFREGNTAFWVSFTYLDLYDVSFSDGSLKTVGEALELGLIGRADLDRFEIPYTESAEGVTQVTEESEEEPSAPEEQESPTQTEAPEKTTAETEGTLNGSGSSRYYTDEDIDQAKEAVRDWMSDAFEAGTELKELYYPGDDFTDEFADSSYDAFDNTGNSMVLGGYFIESDGVERGTSGYPLWVWILGRGSDGGWFVKDAGY